MKKIFFILIFMYSIFVNSYIYAQRDTLRGKAVKVFMDCYFCDKEFLKKEVTYINYVIDSKEADVVILGTSQQTGSSGNKYTLVFLGQKRFKGINDTLFCTLPPSSTKEERRNKILKIYELGLIRYVIHTPLADKVIVQYAGASEDGEENKEVIDKWRNWVFKLGSYMWLNGEETSTNKNINGYFTVSKVTSDVKYLFNLQNSYTENRYSYNNFSYSSIIRNYYADVTIVKSINEHLSYGIFANGGTNSYRNENLYAGAGPGIEYSFFKYSESTHRFLRINYTVNYQYFDYIDTTIFNKIVENAFVQKFDFTYKTTKKWGDVSFSFYGSTYLHDLNLYSLGLWGNVSWRVVKGLSVYTNFSASIIQNQIYLPKENVSIEDLLVGNKSMPTSFSYYTSVGISYTFGSIYNNIVNPRFD